MEFGLGVCHRLSCSGTSLLASLMHGLVTGEDPRQRFGDLGEVGESTGIFWAPVETNDALLQLWAVSGSSSAFPFMLIAPFEALQPIEADSRICP